jgi:27-O-demethylrifamycin SV methyltransferase
MSDASRDIRALYEAVYGEPSPAHEAVRRDGHLPGDEIGQCGYTLPAQLDRLADLLLLGPETRLLDVGCGRGGPTRYLAHRTGCRAIGVDFARSGMALSLRSGAGRCFGVRELAPALESGGKPPHSKIAPRAAFIVGDAAALPLIEACVDAVSSLDVMLYLPDREAFLSECRRVLRPGGRLAIVDEVERGEGLSAEEREARSFFGPAVYDTEASHRARFQAAGLVPVAVEDWTPQFVALNDRWIAARARHREALLAEGGEAAYEAGRRYFTTNRDAARDGRLARLLIVGERTA